LWNDYKTNTVLLTLFSIAVCTKFFFQYNQDLEISSSKEKKSTSTVKKSSSEKIEAEKSTTKTAKQRFV